MRDQLIAALCTAPKADVRQYLVSVLVEATNLETRLISSAGSVMSVQRADAKGDNDVEGAVKVLLPLALLERVKKNRLSDHVEIIRIGDDWHMRDDAAQISFKPMEDRYPDYRRILPAKLSGDAARFDPALLQVFVKAAAVFGLKPHEVQLSPDGEKGMLVSIGRDTEYIGVLMPLREKTLPVKLTAAPSWARAELVAQEELI